jgi:hypothetical protein
MLEETTMSHKLITIGALALAVLLVAPPLALAATETVSGMVQEVDMDNGRLVITTEAHETLELTVPKELLKGLEPGDEVTVQIVDGKVTAIDKDKEALTEAAGRYRI